MAFPDKLSGYQPTDADAYRATSVVYRKATYSFRGERNIAAINLIRIAKALKTEVGDLFPSVRTLNTD